MILSTTSPSTVSTITSASSEPSACAPSSKLSTRSPYRPTTTLRKPAVPPASSSVSLPAPAPISFTAPLMSFFRNDIFDARNVLQTTGTKPEIRQNQFGGSLGGPIYKNRTFFFGDYEGFREAKGLTYTKTTLTQHEYNDVNSLNGGAPRA